MATSCGDEGPNETLCLSQRGAPECGGCAEIRKEMKRVTKPGRFFVVLESDLIKAVAKQNIQKKTRKKKRNCFYEALSALINEGGGVLIMHTDTPEQLNFFEGQVDDKMVNLIPDGSPFHKTFHRRRHKDQKHIVFEVIIHNQRLLSTSNFKSKFSLNRGLTDPSHAQMERAVTEAERGVRSTGDGAGNGYGSLCEGELKKLVIGAEAFLGDHTFGENMSVQAKSISGIQFDREKKRPGVDDIVPYIWKRAKKYITAFSHLCGGGCVYFGVCEEKVAKRSTGRFLYEGIQLSEEEKVIVTERLRKHCQEEMMWLAHSHPQHPVQVKFHELQNPGNATEENAQAGWFVIEVAVSELHGVSFYHPDGPRAFRLNAGTGMPYQVGIPEWTRSYAGKEDPSIKQHQPVFPPLT